MLDPKLIVEVSELNIVELTPIVGDECKWDPKPDNDVLLNKFSYLDLDDHSQWIDFHPLCEVVHGHDEELLLCHHHKKQAEDVDSPLGEGPWYGDGR